MDNSLFFALMYKDKVILEKTIDELKNNFGNIVSESPEYDFDFTDYYEKELGNNLKKTIIIFDKKINNKELINIKKTVTTIEKKYLKSNNRQIINS